MDYYNNMNGPSMDKNKNFSDFNSQEDMMKMMENLNLGPNNEGIFNQISNPSLGMNQMNAGQLDQMKQWGEDDDDLNQALNQISQTQNNQFNIGNMNIPDNLGGIMNSNNEGGQNRKQGNKNQGKKNNNLQQNADNMNIFGQMNPYMNLNSPLMGMNLGNLNPNNLNTQQINENQLGQLNQLNLNPMLLNNMNLNQNLLNNYYSQGNNNLNIGNKSGLLGNMNMNNLLGINNNYGNLLLNNNNNNMNNNAPFDINFNNMNQFNQINQFSYNNNLLQNLNNQMNTNKKSNNNKKGKKKNNKKKNNNNMNNLLQGQVQGKKMGNTPVANKKEIKEEMSLEEIINKADTLSRDHIGSRLIQKKI